MDLRAGPTHKVIRRTSRLCYPQNTPTHLPAGIEGVRTHAYISLLRTSAVVFCLASMANGALETWKNYVGKDEEDRTGLGRAELLY